MTLKYLTTIQFEGGKPKSKTVKSGETEQVFNYINGEEKLTYSKKLEKKKWVEEKYEYNEKGQMINSEIKTGDNKIEKQRFEYHPNGQISSKTTEEQSKGEISEDKKIVTVTFDENGKRLHLSRESYWKYEDMEHSSKDELIFDKIGRASCRERV